MQTGEILGVAAIIVISLTFYLVRSHLLIFSLISLGITGAFIAVASLPEVEKLLYAAGILLYSFGLIVIRVIALRSVSLLLLDRLTSGGNEATVDEEIASRIEDAMRFRLTRSSDGTLRLTALGKTFAGITTVLYFITRQNR
jgi:autotransporter-associated beta strand protein